MAKHAELFGFCAVNFMTTGEINALDQKTSDRIRSQQVIIGIESVIKELIENSLDSNPKNIDIRFQEYGFERVEVIDNGCGIKKSDFDKLARRNFTSKLKDDLMTVNTYGYRGEALFSLANLSNLTIISRHASENLGKKAEFLDGKLINICDIAREIGTTIIVSNLFDAIPVRRNELKKNARTQFSRAEHIIEAYSLICTNIKISYCNSMLSLSTVKPKSAWSSIGADSINKNIEYLVGKSVFDTLLPLEPKTVDLNKSKNSKYSLSSIVMNGYISSLFLNNMSHLKNKSYIFVNNRPCVNQKFNQLIKAIYMNYDPNLKNYFLFLRITAPRDVVDFNASTDKRTIYLKNEKLVEETLKELVENTLSTSQTFKNSKENSLLSNKSIVYEPVESKPQKIDQGITCKFKKYDSPQKLLKSMIESDLQSKMNGNRKMPKPILENSPIKIQGLKINRSIEQTYMDSSSPISSLRTIDVVKEKMAALQQRTEDEIDYNNADFIQTAFGQSLEFEGQTIQEFGNDLIVNVENIHNLNKSDFKNMFIIGQFNLGFILAYFNKNLYIIDQHAADEKYNFERIYHNISSNGQKLLLPKTLDLDNIDFLIFLEHKEAFEKLGFRFEKTKDNVKIVVLPLYNGKVFLDKDDILEFISHIRHIECNQNDSGSSSASITSVSQQHNILKSDKLYSMVASKACRTSVMIGTALDTETMKTIVHNLSKLEKPWSCPHGRPTIRHLAHLS